MKKYLFSLNKNKLIVNFEGDDLISITSANENSPNLDKLQHATQKNYKNVNGFLLAFFHKNFELAEKIRPKINYTLQGTGFQKIVWAEINKIKPGETLSYKAIAERIKNPRASRAVGSACGKNPLPYFIPCHRVIAQNNKLGGYSGGLTKKIELLKNEGVKMAIHLPDLTSQS